jgi:hypothetical protein
VTKFISRAIPIDALRDFAGQRAAAGEYWVSLAEILGWLDLVEPMLEMRGRIADAQAALARGEVGAVDTQLERIDAQLRRILGEK